MSFYPDKSSLGAHITAKLVRRASGVVKQAALVASLALSMGLSAVDRPADAATLTHQWTGNGSVTDTVTGETGSLVNGASYAPGLNGQEAFRFNGESSMVQLGTGDFIGTGGAPYTVNEWIYMTRISTPYALLDGFTSDTQAILVLENNYVVSGQYMDMMFRGYVQYWVPIDENALVDHWANLTFEYNGGDKNLASSFSYYIDGIPLTAPAVNVGETGFALNDNRLGLDHISNTDFSGLMQYTRIYSGDLTASQVNYLYNHPGAPLSSVPEPSTWAVLLAGFGAIGITIRRRRRAGLIRLGRA